MTGIHKLDKVSCDIAISQGTLSDKDSRHRTPTRDLISHAETMHSAINL